jgi:hypothetical protein
MTDRVLDLLPGGPIDLAQDIAAPVPLFTTASTLDLPHDDWSLLRPTFEPFVNRTEPFRTSTVSIDSNGHGSAPGPIDVLEVTGGFGAAGVDDDTAAPVDDGLQSLPGSRGGDR